MEKRYHTSLRQRHNSEWFEMEGIGRAFGAMTKDKLQMTEYPSHAMRKDISRG
jgi:hypothetical protein